MYDKLRAKINKKQNTCGPCIQCCDGHLISTIGDKTIQYIGKSCIFLKHNSCGIYDVRPTGCRNFFCLYIKDDSLPQTFRPDLSGILLVNRFLNDFSFLDITFIKPFCSPEVFEWIYKNYQEKKYPNIRVKINDKVYFFTEIEKNRLRMKNTLQKDNFTLQDVNQIDFLKFFCTETIK